MFFFNCFNSQTTSLNLLIDNWMNEFERFTQRLSVPLRLHQRRPCQRLGASSGSLHLSNFHWMESISRTTVTATLHSGQQCICIEACSRNTPSLALIAGSGGSYLNGLEWTMDRCRYSICGDLFASKLIYSKKLPNKRNAQEKLFWSRFTIVPS